MPQRSIPKWLTIDLAIIVLGLVIMGIGVWIGFDGHSFPFAAIDRPVLQR
jgi:hypothetical protein